MKIRSFSAAIVLCLAAGQAQAYDFLTGGIAYNVLTNTTTRKTAAVTYVTTNPDASGYVTTYRGDLVIPAQVTRGFDTYNVTQIGNLAMFNNQSLYTLRLPEGIVAIGSQAFSHCYSLTSINFPESVNRIADYAFEYCEDLTTVSLPARLATVGDGVFQQCRGLRSIEVDPECVDFKSINGILYGNVASSKGMTLLVYPGSHPASQYIMPEGVTSIDTYALSVNSTMRSLTLGKDLADFDMLVFTECEALEEINVAEGNTHFASNEGVLFTADGKKLVTYPLMRSANCYTVPEGVTTMGALAFYLAQDVQSLILPSTLRAIEELAFYGAQSFHNVICEAALPPSWTSSTLVPGAGLFDAMVYSQATLYVPDQSVDAYRKASGWKNFGNIRPISESGIGSVAAEEPAAPAEYYNLRGQRLSSPAPGLTLIRRGSQTLKQLHK